MCGAVSPALAQPGDQRVVTKPDLGFRGPGKALPHACCSKQISFWFSHKEQQCLTLLSEMLPRHFLFISPFFFFPFSLLQIDELYLHS